MGEGSGGIEFYDYGKTVVNDELIFPKTGEWARCRWRIEYDGFLEFREDRTTQAEVRARKFACGHHSDSPYLDESRLETLTEGQDASSLHNHASLYSDTGHTHDLDDLSDVNAGSPSDGQVLTWDNASSKWINDDPTGGGGGAPTDASYVVLGADGTLTDERVLTAGTGIDVTDAGAGSTVTISTDDSEIDHDSLSNTHNLTTDIDHNQLTNYAVGEHRTINDSGTGTIDLWSGSKINSELGGKADSDHNHDASDITTGTLLHERGGLEADVSAYNGLVKISGGSTSAVTDNSSNWDDAYTHSQGDGSDHADVASNTTHRSSNGTDHSYIDQDVQSTASPTFSQVTISASAPVNDSHAVRKDYVDALASTDVWIAAGDSWTYSTATTHDHDADDGNVTYSGSFTVSGDETTKYRPGTRVKFTQNSKTKYGIVVYSSYSSPNTTVYVFQGTCENYGATASDYAIDASNAITSPYVSYQRFPEGLETDPIEWEIRIHDTDPETKPAINDSNPGAGAPASGTWYHFGGGDYELTIPPGTWELYYSCCPSCVSDGVTYAAIQASITTDSTPSSPTETNKEFGTYRYIYKLESSGTNVAYAVGSVYVKDFVSNTANETYYFIIRTPEANQDRLYLDARSEFKMVGRCPYL